MAQCLRPLIAHPEDLSFIPKPTSGSSELPMTADSEKPTPLISYGVHTHKYECRHHTHTQTCMHACTRAHTHMHACTRTCTHTHFWQLTKNEMNPCHCT